MKKEYRYLLTSRMQGLVYHLIRAYSGTFRLRIENEKPWQEHVQQGGRVLLCCWHQQFFSAIRHFKTYTAYRPALMISQSKDGDIVAAVAERSGWRTARGSSSRDGGRALKEMVSHLQDSGLAAHIVDGPRGPAGIIKAGVISLARAAGAYIVPIFVTADRGWYFNSWDRFLLPKPFANVTLRFGEMMDLGDEAKGGDFEGQRIRLQTIMHPGLLSGPAR